MGNETPTNDAPVTVEQDPYLATIEEFEHEDQRELCRLYNHRPDDSLQFSRSNMREAIRHGRRLAALASAPAGDGIPSTAEVAEAIRIAREQADKVYGVRWMALEEISRHELVAAALARPRPRRWRNK